VLVVKWASLAGFMARFVVGFVPKALGRFKALAREEESAVGSVLGLGLELEIEKLMILR
jgi:hypothetical protein